MSSWIPDAAYEDFITQFAGIVNPVSLSVRIDPTENNGANVLNIYTGTVELGTLFSLRYEGPLPFPPVQQSAEAWSRGTFEFVIPTPGFTWTGLPADPISPKSTYTYLHQGTVVVSLASIFNEYVSNSAGWAVDGANLQALANEEEGLQVQAKVAVRDTDGHLYRLAYQVTALGQAPAVRRVETGPFTEHPRHQ